MASSRAGQAAEIIHGPIGGVPVLRLERHHLVLEAGVLRAQVLS